MKITNIEVYLHYSVWRNLIIVRVDTDEGITGVGEATLSNHETAVKSAIDTHIAPYIMGESPYMAGKLFDRFYSQNAWRGGAVMLSAISGIEIALWDIIAKKAGQPIYNMIGGKHHKRIRTFASGWDDGCKTSDDVIKAAKAVVARGFTAIKLEPLKLNPRSDKVSEREMAESALENIYGVRKALGKDVDLCIDLQGILTYDGALIMHNGLVDLDVMFIDDPMNPDDREGLRKLSMKALVPIAGGERVYTRYGYKSFIADHYHSVARPDLTHGGGIWETKLLGAMLENAYILIAPHNTNGIVATMANVVNDATMPNCLIQEVTIEALDLNDKLLKGKATWEKGYFELPDKPGLGIEPDWDAIKAGAFKPVLSEVRK